MIHIETVKQYCKEYWKIENYQEAINDTTQIWDCHHRHEIDWVLPREELIAIGRYYDVHYSELIFLTHREHASLHHKGKEGYWKNKIGPMKDKSLSEETKQKISDTMKGRNHIEETKQKISDSTTKYKITKEELYDLYIVQGLSQCQIAKKYSCNQTTISLKLKKYNIKK